MADLFALGPDELPPPAPGWPWPHPDPDPLDVQLENAYQAGWEDGATTTLAGVRPGLPIARIGLLILAAFIVGLLAGVHVADAAAPQPAQAAIPAGGRERIWPSPDSQPSSGNLPALTGAPLGPVAGSSPASRARVTPSPGGGAPPAIASGLIAYAAPSHGSRYLAVPGGPGHLIRICVSGGHCLIRRSTDAGPARFLQGRGRIADVSFPDFAWLCECRPSSVGLVVGTIEDLDPGQLPVTDR